MTQDETAPSPPIRAPGWSGWWLVAVVVAALLLSYIDRGILSLFGQTLRADMGLSDSEIGLLFGLGFIGPLALASLVVGWAVDRFNRVGIIVFGILSWSAATAACGLAGSYPWLLAARGGVGAGEATLTPAAYAMIGDRFPPERRGRAIGVVSIAVGAGVGGALIVGGWLLSVIGPAPRELPGLGVLEPWRLTFLILGLAGVPVALLAMTLRDPRRGKAGGGVAKPAGPGFWSFVRRQPATIFAIFASGSLSNIAGTGVMVWAPTVLQRRFDMPAIEVGYLLGGMAVAGGLLGNPICAEFSDRCLRKGAPGARLFGHPIILALVALGAALLALGPNPWVAAFGILLVVGCTGGISAVSYAAVQDVAPAALRGRTTAALQFTILTLGYALGPSLVAGFTDLVFADDAKVSLSIVAVAVPLCVAGALCSLVARGNYAKSLAEAQAADRAAA